MTHKLLDVGIGRAIADDCDIELYILVKGQGPLDSPNDPGRFVAERSATEQRKKQSVTSMVDRIQDRRTNGCLIGCLEKKPCECSAKVGVSNWPYTNTFPFPRDVNVCPSTVMFSRT